jgi:hypothetical protein
LLLESVVEAEAASDGGQEGAVTGFLPTALVLGGELEGLAVGEVEFPAGFIIRQGEALRGVAVRESGKEVEQLVEVELGGRLPRRVYVRRSVRYHRRYAP